MSDSSEIKLETRLRVLRILWFAMMMNVVVLFLVTLFFNRPMPQVESTMALLFPAIGLVITALSFVVRNKMLNVAINSQQVQAVQPAFIIAWAMCEVSALLGVFESLTLGSRSYIVMFVISELGMFLHTPKFDHLAAANYKQSGGMSA